MKSTPHRKHRNRTRRARPRRGTLVLGALLALMAGISGVLALGGGGETSAVRAEIVILVDDNGLAGRDTIAPSADAGSEMAALNVGGVLDMAVPASNPCPPTNPTGCVEPWKGAYDIETMPAWRWRDIDLDLASSGGWAIAREVAGAFKQIPVTIAEIFFHAANFLWLLLLSLMSMGFNAKGLLGVGAQSINTGAAFMADKLWYFAVPLSAYVMWNFLRDFIKLRGGNPFGLMRRVGVFAVFLGLLWMVTTSSKEAITQNVGNPDAQLEQVGTIPWMAKEILDIGDLAVAPLAGVVINTDKDSTEKPADEQIAGERGNLANEPTTGSNLTGSAGDNGKATCTAYIQALHATYARGENAERALIIVSRLWEGTFYQALKSASFGEPAVYRTPDGTAYASDIPDRVMCHYMEAINDVPPQTQQKVARLAYGEAVPAENGLSAVPIVFLTGNAVKKDDQRKAMVAWAACRWNGSAWDGQPEFNGAHASSGSDNPFDGLCAEVMQEAGSGPTKLGEDSNAWDEKFWVFGSGIPDAVSQGDAVHQAQLQAARTWAVGYSGGNFGGRMISAFIAFIVALLFLYSFGLLGLGLTISMMIAVALLALALPAAFVLASIGKSKQAAPLLKMTLFSVLAHAFLTALLSIIVIISGIFQNLLGSFAGLPLMIRSLTTGLAPVVAFFIVRKVMKSIGMGDILSPTGALSFAGAAALSGGGKLSAKAQSSLASGSFLKKAPGLSKRLDRLDGMAPTWKNWSPDGYRKRMEENNKQDALDRKKRLARIDERNNKAANKRREQVKAEFRLEGKDDKWFNTQDGRTEVQKRMDELEKKHPLKKPNRLSKGRDELLNTIDKARMPGSVKDRLKRMTIEDNNGLAASGLRGTMRGAEFLGKAGLAGLGILATWPALLAGSVPYGLIKYRALGRDVAKAAAIDYLDAGGPPVGAPVDPATKPHPTFKIGATETGPDAETHRTVSIKATADLVAAKGVIDGAAAMLTGIAGGYGISAVGADGKPIPVVLDPSEREQIKVSAAAIFGCRSTEVLVTPGGVAMPTPAMENEPDHEKRRELDNTEHGLGHFVHWLPEEDRRRRTIDEPGRDGTPVTREESAGEYAARLAVIGACRGGVRPDGTHVDVRSLALGGADMSSEDVIRVIEQWQDGTTPNDALDTFRLLAGDREEEKLILAAYARVREDERILLERSGVVPPPTADAGDGSTKAAADAAERLGWGELARQLRGDGSTKAAADAASSPETLALLQRIASGVDRTVVGVNRTADGVERIDAGIGNLRGQVERVAVSMDAARPPTGSGSTPTPAGSTGGGSGAPSAATPPAESAIELAEATKQLMVAVSAARELFASAKLSGDDAKIGAAAGTLSTVLTAFAEKQEELLEAHGHRLISGFSGVIMPLGKTIEENTMAVAGLKRHVGENSTELVGLKAKLGATAADMGAYTQKMATVIGSVENGLKFIGTRLGQFTAGALSLEKAVAALDQVMRDTADLEAKADAAQQQALAELENAGGQQIRDARTGGKTKKTPSAGDVARRSKAEKLPDEE